MQYLGRAEATSIPFWRGTTAQNQKTLAYNIQAERRQEDFSAPFSQIALKPITLTSAAMNHQKKSHQH